MKTFPEVADWIIGAAERFGDPSAVVCQLFVRYLPDVAAYRGDELVCGGASLALWLSPELSIPLAISRNGCAPLVNAVGELTAFAAHQVCAGVWFLTPSLNVPGTIHAFIVLYDVPDPAPWLLRAGRDALRAGEAA
jgi:hypothetical protein